MKKMTKAWVIMAVLFITGCSPLYQLPKNTQALAQINVKELYIPSIVKDRTIYRLAVNNAGFTKVPAGKKIIIGNNYISSENPENLTSQDNCFPLSSFLPNQKFEYYLKFGHKNHHNQRCYLKVLKRPVGTIQPYAIDKSAQYLGEYKKYLFLY